MGRPARALVNAQALRHNLEQVRKHAPRSRVMAIVKANAYGHGLDWAAQVLHSADAFGVSSVEEAIRLRGSGAAEMQPICLLEGFFGADEIPLAAEHRLSAIIHHEGQLEMLESAKVSVRVPVWIKVDTGMHRVGFTPDQLPQVLTRLKACAAVGEIRVMSHLANADNKFDSSTGSQIKRFMAVVSEFGLEASLANSAGILAWPESHFDWVRPGIMLYGASPLAGYSARELNLRPVMTFCTALIAVNRRRKGDAIGYGGAWHCPEDMPVGVAAVGYGDGYPRHAAQGTPVLLNGEPVPLVGRVSMDMITLDLRSQPQAKAGDPVILWGTGLAVEEVAAQSGTIAYELLCQVMERIPRIAIAS